MEEGGYSHLQLYAPTLHGNDAKLTYCRCGGRVIGCTEQLPIDLAMGVKLPFLLIVQSPIELMINTD